MKCGTAVQAQPEKLRSLFALVGEELYMYWVYHQQQRNCIYILGLPPTANKLSTSPYIWAPRQPSSDDLVERVVFTCFVDGQQHEDVAQTVLMLRRFKLVLSVFTLILSAFPIYYFPPETSWSN